MIYRDLLNRLDFEKLMPKIKDEQFIETLYAIPFDDSKNMVPLVFALHVVNVSKDNKTKAFYCSVISVLMHLHYSNYDNCGYDMGLLYAQKAISLDNEMVYKQRILSLYSLLLPEEVLDPHVGKQICIDLLKQDPEDAVALDYCETHSNLWQI